MQFRRYGGIGGIRVMADEAAHLASGRQLRRQNNGGSLCAGQILAVRRVGQKSYGTRSRILQGGYSVDLLIRITGKFTPEFYGKVSKAP